MFSAQITDTLKRVAFWFLIGLSATNQVYGKTTEITIWEQDQIEIQKEMDKWITVFQKENPGIKITRQHYENETMRTKFLRSAVTGDGADIIYGPNDIAGVFATANVIHEVSDLSPKGKFNPELVNIVKLKDKVWGMPVSEGNHLMLLYNKKMVPNAPKTTDELIQVAKKFSSEKNKTYGLAFFQSEPYWFVPILGGYGASPLSKEQKTITVNIDNEATKKALQFLVDLKNKHKVIPQDCDYNCAKSMFMSQKTPFHITGDWDVQGLRDTFGANLGIAPLPIISETGLPMRPYLGGRFLFFNKASSPEKLKAAKKFAQFIASRRIQLRLAKRVNRIPATLEARQDPKVQKLTKLKPLMEAAKHGTAAPAEVEMRAAWDGMRIMIQRALSGKENIATATKTGQKAADEALKAL